MLLKYQESIIQYEKCHSHRMYKGLWKVTGGKSYLCLKELEKASESGWHVSWALKNHCRFSRYRLGRQGKGNRSRKVHMYFSEMMSIPEVVGALSMQAGSLGLLLPGTECMLIDKPCRSLKRMQQKEEENVPRGKTKAGHPLSPSRMSGRQKWILRAPVLCQLGFPPPWLHCPSPLSPTPYPRPQEQAEVLAAVSEWKDRPACVFGQDSFGCMSVSFFSLSADQFLFFVFCLFCTNGKKVTTPVLR